MVFTLALPFSAFGIQIGCVASLLICIKLSLSQLLKLTTHMKLTKLTTPAAHRRQLTLKMNGSWPLTTLLVWAPGKGEPRHPAEEAHFGHLYSRSRSFGHYPQLVTIGEGRNVDWPINPRASPSTDPPVSLPLHSSLTREQDPEILELLHLGKDFIRAFNPIPFPYQHNPIQLVIPTPAAIRQEAGYRP